MTVSYTHLIEEPIAKGIAIGSASHAVGTAKAMELGEIEGAMSSLSIAVSGILTEMCIRDSLFTEQKCCISVQASEAARGKKITFHECTVDGTSVTGIFV